MAIYHAEIKPVSRSGARSVIAAAAYRAGVILENPRDGVIHDYAARSPIDSDIIGWSGTRQDLWGQTEILETRKNARLAVEVVVALPSELSPHHRHILVQAFASEISREYGVPVDIAIHRPDRRGDHRNHHAHMLVGCRASSDGVTLGGRIVPFDGPDHVRTWRARWADRTNAALETYGSDARIDHRSYDDQGIPLTPTIHMGVIATAMERKGRATRLGAHNRRIAARNAPIRARHESTRAAVATRRAAAAVLEAEAAAHDAAARIDDIRAADADRAAARESSVAAIRAAWGRGPRAGDDAIVFHWKEATGICRVARLVREIGLSEATDPEAPAYRTAHVSVDVLADHRTSLPEADRARFDVDLCTASGLSGETLHGRWHVHYFANRAPDSLALHERILSSTMRAAWGGPSHTIDEILREMPGTPGIPTMRFSSADLQTGANRRDAPTPVSEPIAPARVAAPPPRGRPDRRPLISDGTVVQVGADGGGWIVRDPISPPVTSRPAAEPFVPARPDIPAQPPERPIGAAAADALLREAGVVYVGTTGTAEIAMNVPGRQADPPVPGSWDPWGVIRRLRVTPGSRIEKTLAGLTWSVIRLRVGDLTRAIGCQTRDIAVGWIEALIRTGQAGEAVKSAARTAEALRIKTADAARTRAAEDAKMAAAEEAAARAPPRPSLAPAPGAKKPPAVRIPGVPYIPPAGRPAKKRGRGRKDDDLEI